MLTYHVASGNVQAKDVKDGEMIKTVEGKDVRARVVDFGSTYPKKGTRPPLQNTRAEVLDTRSSGLCRGRVVVNACLGWSYG